jgi:hypothetical protein
VVAWREHIYHWNFLAIGQCCQWDCGSCHGKLLSISVDQFLESNLKFQSSWFVTFVVGIIYITAGGVSTAEIRLVASSYLAPPSMPLAARKWT